MVETSTDRSPLVLIKIKDHMIVPSRVNRPIYYKFRKSYLPMGGCIPYISATPGPIDTKQRVRSSTDRFPLTSIKITRPYDHSFPFKLSLFFRISQITHAPWGNV